MIIYILPSKSVIKILKMRWSMASSPSITGCGPVHNPYLDTELPRRWNCLLNLSALADINTKRKEVVLLPRKPSGAARGTGRDFVLGVVDVLEDVFNLRGVEFWCIGSARAGRSGASAVGARADSGDSDHCGLRLSLR